MSPNAYRLNVQDQLEERQIRRLGAAVCLLWDSLDEALRAKLLNEAANIYISGEDVPSADLRSKIKAFVESGTVSRP